MEDKLLKILKIKIDAINRNIDNLNYLNGELERNNKDLGYVEEKLSLFADGDILNFDNVSRDDFEKLLLMVDSSVSDIFKDKTCNYDGIIYIIEGIRKSISLELTKEQTNAIKSFIDGMNNKRDKIAETISNLTESKNRLPETDLSVLNDNLDNYNNIVSKFENKIYLEEIDEITEALDFAEVDVLEKASIYEYILKYNADIYASKENNNVENNYDNDIANSEEFKTDLPDFNYDTVEITKNLLDEKDKDENIQDSKDESISFDDIKLNLDNFKFNNEKTMEIPVQNDVDLPEISRESNLNIENDSNVNYAPLEFKTDFSTDKEKEFVSGDENKELNTIELDDIIKKIDAKLKEMEDDENKLDDEVQGVDIEIPKEYTSGNELEEKEMEQEDNLKPNIEDIANIPVEVSSPDITEEKIENNSLESNLDITSQISLNDLYNKYSLGEFNINNSNLLDVDNMLQLLVDNNLLDLFKENKNILELMLSNYNKNDLEELITLIKDNLIVKGDDFNSVFSILIETLPSLFTNVEIYKSFKDNINFYKDKNINIINIFDNYRELLIINHELLVSNYNKVISYGIDVNSDNVKYLLYNKNIINNLDYYIEAIGYEKGFLGKEDRFDGVEYIKKNPYKLNDVSRDMLLKLRYTSENNGKIYGNKPGILAGEIANSKVDIINLTSDYLNTYFNGEYTNISKEELKKELENLDGFDMTIDDNLNMLDKKYKKDELRYQFDNVIISRIKTIRIYNYLKTKLSSTDALIVALTYNSVIKKTEYDNIVNIINNTMGGM